jgi:hypothetical protein
MHTGVIYNILDMFFCISPYRILCCAYNGSLVIIIKLKNFAGLHVVLCNKKFIHVALSLKPVI